jgi:hypothetical protein
MPSKKRSEPLTERQLWTKIEQLNGDVRFLADRLALALLTNQRDLFQAIITLPSRESDREALRGDVDYERFLGLVREVLNGNRKA